MTKPKTDIPPKDRRTRAQLIRALANHGEQIEKQAIELHRLRDQAPSGDTMTAKAPSAPPVVSDHQLTEAVGEVVQTAYVSCGAIRVQFGRVANRGPDGFGDPRRLHTSVFMPMETAKILQQALTRLLKLYERARGVIPVAEGSHYVYPEQPLIEQMRAPMTHEPVA